MTFKELCNDEGFANREVPKAVVASLRFDPILEDILNLRKDRDISNLIVRNAITSMSDGGLSTEEKEQIKHHNLLVDDLTLQIQERFNDSVDFLIGIAIEDGLPEYFKESYRDVFSDYICALLDTQKELRYFTIAKLYNTIGIGEVKII